MDEYLFESCRLGFRMWREADKELFAKMNADEEVMRYFPKRLTCGESDDFFGRIQEHFKRKGYGLWAVEIKHNREFIGFIGFLTATFPADFTPCIEIGWRLDKKYWNQGYATEGAKACLELGFTGLDFAEIYSFTAKINLPSIRVMEKIGLTKIGEFAHPGVKECDPLKPHVLFKIEQKEYKAGE